MKKIDERGDHATKAKQRNQKEEEQNSLSLSILFFDLLVFCSLTRFLEEKFSYSWIETRLIRLLAVAVVDFGSVFCYLRIGKLEKNLDI